MYELNNINKLFNLLKYILIFDNINTNKKILNIN